MSYLIDKSNSLDIVPYPNREISTSGQSNSIRGLMRLWNDFSLISNIKKECSAF